MISLNAPFASSPMVQSPLVIKTVEIPETSETTVAMEPAEDVEIIEPVEIEAIPEESIRFPRIA